MTWLIQETFLVVLLQGDQLTLLPKRIRCAVSMRADDTDKWGNETLDEREDYQLVLRDSSIKVRISRVFALSRSGFT